MSGFLVSLLWKQEQDASRHQGFSSGAIELTITPVSYALVGHMIQQYNV
jgi:hypothetical protein